MTTRTPAMSAREDKSPPLRIVSGVEERLSHDDLCRLSRAFGKATDYRTDQDMRINEWLKAQIAKGQLFRRDDEDPLDYQDGIDEAARANDAALAEEALSPPTLVEGGQQDQELTVSGAGAESGGFAARTDAPHSAGGEG